MSEQLIDLILLISGDYFIPLMRWLRVTSPLNKIFSFFWSLVLVFGLGRLFLFRRKVLKGVEGGG